MSRRTNNYYEARDNYERKIWGVGALRQLVVRGKIKASEFEEIVGIPYEESED